MIIGIGTDLLQIQRMVRPLNHPHFVERIFTAKEQYCLGSVAQPHQWAAGRWAAKEAVAKALGCGFRRCPPWDVEILSQEGGAPAVTLYGKAAVYLQGLGGGKIWVSISHESRFVLAVAIIEQ